MENFFILSTNIVADLLYVKHYYTLFQMEKKICSKRSVAFLLIQNLSYFYFSHNSNVGIRQAESNHIKSNSQLYKQKETYERKKQIIGRI